MRPRVFIGAALAASLPAAGTFSPFAISNMERRPLRGGGGGGSAAYDSHLENENDAQIAALAGKVGALKDISSQINIHIKGDNKMLDELDTSFDATGGLLGGVTKRLNVVANAAGGWGNMCYLAMFVVAVFLILWRMTKG